jgi:hypothetical protein
MAFLVEVVVNGAVNRGERLQTSHAPEPEHRPFSSSKRLVRTEGPRSEFSTRLFSQRPTSRFSLAPKLLSAPP